MKEDAVKEESERQESHWTGDRFTLKSQAKEEDGAREASDADVH